MKVLDKKRIIGIILGALLVLAMGVKFYLDYKEINETEEKIATADAKKFKKEYEDLNGTTAYGEIKYKDLKISEYIPVLYKTDEEIVNILNNGTGVIYFGFNSCPWCRIMIETLIKVIDDYEVENFYYTDIKQIRSTFKVENKKLVETKGTKSYYDILEKLDEYLTDYVITNNNKDYDTNEKRLYAPTVVVVKEGEILGVHEVTVDSQTNPFDGLNDTQKEELYGIYEEMIKNLDENTCSKAGC